ncbi:hypothetical protein PHLCEN_2v3811, partial [Hermanssonia centrifuga]
MSADSLTTPPRSGIAPPLFTSTPRRPRRAPDHQGPKQPNYDDDALREMAGSYLEVPLREFMTDWMPQDHNIPKLPDDVSAEVLDCLEPLKFVKKETEMYPPLCKAFEAILKDTNYVIKDTANKREGGSWVDSKPDLSMYKNDGPGKAAWTVPDKELKVANVDAERLPYYANSTFTWPVCLVEVKLRRHMDPFKKGEGGQLQLSGGKEATRFNSQIT